MNDKITKNSLKIVNENGIRKEQRSLRKNLLSLGILFSLMLLFSSQIYSQTTQNVTIPSGSFIVNMGISPQTYANGAWVHSTGNGTNTGCKSGVWLGCHAGSALEDMFNPAIPDQQTNFLAAKNQIATGTGPWYQNALTLWGNHSSGTIPYSYDYSPDPIKQFLGIMDAATLNGSEQIYIPRSAGWYANTKVGVYDQDHPQRYPHIPPYTGYEDPKHRSAILAYAPAFGVTGNGKIMLEASHSECCLKRKTHLINPYRLSKISNHVGSLNTPNHG